MESRLSIIALLVLSCWFTSLSAQNKLAFPATAVKPTVKNYFGTVVTDNYAWLENTADKETQDWLGAQRAFTDSFLSSLPYLSQLEKNIKNKGIPTVHIPPSRKKYSFALFKPEQDNAKGSAVLYYREKEEQQWKELLDPARYSTSGSERIVLTNYTLSDDGNNLAFSISRNGSDWNEIRVINMDNRKPLSDSICWLKSPGVVWYKNGFFYWRSIRPSNSRDKWTAVAGNEEFCYHKLNTAATEDVLIPIKNCRNIDIVDSNLVVYTTEYVGGVPYYAVSVLNLNKDGWEQDLPRKFMMHPAITRYDIDVVTVRNDSAIVRNNFLAGNGMLASFSLKELNSYRVLIPEYNEVLTNAFFKLGKLHCLYKNDTSYVMIQYSPEGSIETGYDFGRYMAVHDFRAETPSVDYYLETSFDRPAIQYAFNFDTYTPEIVGATYVPYDVNNYVSRQVTYISSDSTPVLMTLFYKKGIRISEKTPVLLTAYGGFGVINDPTYDYTNILWAESGGIYAVAHIRGGGEKGKKWHMAGSRKNKIQCINDFVWAAKFLIGNKYTSPAKLAITGSSHGGLVVAAAVNEYPELFGAAVPVVGLYDMLNYQHYTVGTRFSDEFGTSADSVSFSTIYKYSPYHHIKTTVAYPPMLVMTGDNDDRVPPFNAYKYVAALQANTNQLNPALLYVTANAGHNGGITNDERAKEKAYLLAFLFHALNIKPVLMY